MDAESGKPVVLHRATVKWNPWRERWIMIAGIGLQPSEFLKPAFVIIAAWAFSEGSRRKDMPVFTNEWIAAVPGDTQNRPLEDIRMTITVEEMPRRKIERLYGYTYPEK
mgnify:CR=1 FL=1